MDKKIPPSEHDKKGQGEVLGKIEVEKKSKEELEKFHSQGESTAEKLNTNDKHKVEISLLEASRLLLRVRCRKSTAAVRDAVEIPHDEFKQEQAINIIIFWLQGELWQY